MGYVSLDPYTLFECFLASRYILKMFLLSYTVLLSKRPDFRFEELQLKYSFHVFPKSYIY